MNTKYDDGYEGMRRFYAGATAFIALTLLACSIGGAILARDPGFLWMLGGLIFFLPSCQRIVIYYRKKRRNQ